MQQFKMINGDNLRFMGGSGMDMVGGILGGKEGGKIVDLRCLMHS